ncbi:DUF805 domain-containing protein [Stutzerimonas xanthomarina]|uniref:DUF805 domain-containing protein n=1 Tax=Stutzerimonas xanthomarina TaxID=271420 RepID=UPI003AA868CC
MSADQYRIVFDGELVAGVSPDTAKSNLIRLFKCDAGKIERLFGHGSVQIKRDLSAREADRYLQALHRAGVHARKEPESAKGFTLAIAEYAPAQPSDAPVITEQMACPKCGHTQPAAIECCSCGIVIQKYLARQALQGETSAQSHSTAHPYAPPRAEVGEPPAEYSQLKVFTIHGRIGRLRYLAWSMALMAAALGLLLASGMTFAASTVLGVILTGVFGIGFLLVSIQIGVQRLHDVGWSGWFMLLYLVPIIGTVFPLVVLLMPGNAGPNRFGPPQPPNSRAVKILAALWLLVPVVAILTAIVLPTHQ